MSKASTHAAVKNERERCAKAAEDAGRHDIAETIRGFKGTTGRPKMNYDPEIGLTICAGIASGMSVEEICENADMPGTTTVFEWLASTTAFAASYARAREQQMDVWAEQIVQIADDARNDYMERQMQNGRIERVLDPENINRSKLRIETRKWIMGRLAAKRYGDKIEIEQTVTIETVPDAELQARVMARMERLGIAPPTAGVLMLGHEAAPESPNDDGSGENPGTDAAGDDVCQ